MRSKFRIHALPALAGAAAALALGACGSHGSGSAAESGAPRVIVASSEPLRAVAADVAGPGWTVTSLLAPGAEPETFDPTMSTLREAAEADLAVMSGVSLPERKLFERLLASGRNIPTVNVADSVTLITDTHGGDTPDPHLWLSTRNLAAMTRAVADGLAAVDPGRASYYASRADSIAAAYARLGSQLRAAIDSLAPGAAFVVDHPSLSYFAAEFGLEQIALGHENKEMSAKGMAAKIARIAERRPAVYFVESAADSLRAIPVAADAGLPVVVLPTNNGSPADAIRAAADALTRH